VFPFEEQTMYDFMRLEHRMDWDLANYAFGAEAGHPFIEAIIENCVRSLRDGVWFEKMMRNIPGYCRSQYLAPASTGPGVVSRTLAERADLASRVTILFPNDVRRRADWHCFGDFGVHLMRASWRPKDGWVRARLMRFWERRQLARAPPRPAASAAVPRWIGGSRSMDRPLQHGHRTKAKARDLRPSAT
jgi:hypothetical protein